MAPMITINSAKTTVAMAPAWTPTPKKYGYWRQIGKMRHGLGDIEQGHQCGL